jgi:hypothetical protein
MQRELRPHSQSGESLDKDAERIHWKRILFLKTVLEQLDIQMEESEHPLLPNIYSVNSQCHRHESKSVKFLEKSQEKICESLGVQRFLI